MLHIRCKAKIDAKTDRSVTWQWMIHEECKQRANAGSAVEDVLYNIRRLLNNNDDRRARARAHVMPRPPMPRVSRVTPLYILWRSRGEFHLYVASTMRSMLTTEQMQYSDA